MAKAEPASVDNAGTLTVTEGMEKIHLSIGEYILSILSCHSLTWVGHHNAVEDLATTPPLKSNKAFLTLENTLDNNSSRLTAEELEADKRMSKIYYPAKLLD